VAERSKAVVRTLVIGWRELVTLPALRLHALKAKVDTGARSSSLDADDVAIRKVGRTKHVSFTVHFETDGAPHSVRCEAPLVDERWVTSSDGRREFRPVIQTELQLCGETWPIEITLTSRTDMSFAMLLGRQAIRKRFVVDPGRSFLAPKSKKVGRTKAAPKRLLKKSVSPTHSTVKAPSE